MCLIAVAVSYFKIFFQQLTGFLKKELIRHNVLLQCQQKLILLINSLISTTIGKLQKLMCVANFDKTNDYAFEKNAFLELY